MSWVEIITVEFIPLSLGLIYLNINILLRIGKPFSIIYTSLLIGLCKTGLSQLACEQSVENRKLY